MHPAFEGEGLWFLTLEGRIRSEAECISFLQDIQLIPKKNDAPACPECSGCMEAVDQEIAWQWICRKETCSGHVNALKNTFFEDIQLPLLDALALILNFTDRQFFCDARQNCRSFSWKRTESVRTESVSKESVKQVYAKCRRVCEIIMSQTHERMVSPYNSTLYLMYLKRTLNVGSLSRGSKAYIFLMDVKAVYPGYDKTGLNYKRGPIIRNIDIRKEPKSWREKHIIKFSKFVRIN